VSSLPTDPSSGPRAGLLIRAFGLRRSGNHAIISWLLDHLSGPILHLNNVKTSHPDPFMTFGRAITRRIPYHRCSRSRWMLAKHWARCLIRGRQRCVFPRIASSTSVSSLRTLARSSSIVCSYEDCDLSDPFIACTAEPYREHFGERSPLIDLLVLRDPFNTFASLLKSGMMHDGNRERVVALYKQYCRVFTGLDRLLDPRHRLVVANYNRWFSDAEYRNELAGAFGFSVSGQSYEFVPSHGGGSSFTGTAMNGRGADMQVLERWRYFESDPSFRSLFDPELLQLSAKVFGPPPPSLVTLLGSPSFHDTPSRR
jgi:hypothetical protein